MSIVAVGKVDFGYVSPGAVYKIILKNLTEILNTHRSITFNIRYR